MKVCTKCDVELGSMSFYKDSRAKSGLSSKCKDCCKVYYKPTTPERKAQHQVWKDANKEHIAAYEKDYRARKKDQIYAKNNARHKRVQQATPLWADMNAIRDIYLEAQYMQMEVDHIYPLNGKTVSGLHVWDNLQLLTKEQNLRKSNTYG